MSYQVLKILVVRRTTGRLTNGYPAAVLVVPDKRISVYFERWLLEMAIV